MQQERTANKAECEFHLVWWCLSTQREDTPNKSHILSIWKTKADTDSRGDMLHWPLRTSLLSHLVPPSLPTLPPSLPISYSYFPLKHPTELLMGIADYYICSYNSQTFLMGIGCVQTIGDTGSVDGISGSVGQPPPVMRRPREHNGIAG